MGKIEVNHYWTKLDKWGGFIRVLRNQDIQLQIESDDSGNAYINLSKNEVKQLSNMLLLAIDELDESQLNK
jgi:uncharacterized protein YhdP